MSKRLIVLTISIVLLCNLIFTGYIITSTGKDVESGTFEILNSQSFSQNNNILSNIPQFFTENRGQLENDDVRFYSRGTDIWFTDDGVWFKIKEPIGIKPPDSVNPYDQYLYEETIKNLNCKQVILKQEFLGANEIHPVGRTRLDHNSNFFYGNDSSKWQTKVPNYQEIFYGNLYDGIDLRYYLNENGLKYDFIVHPGADPNQIRINFRGAETLEILDNTNLIVRTELGEIKDTDLFIYQDQSGLRKNIEGAFVELNEFEYGFEIIGKYQHDEILIIDPKVALKYSTFIGGGNEDMVHGIDTDSSGNTYVICLTQSSDYPKTTGVLDTTHNGDRDVGISKMNEKGTQLLYSTFIGGSGRDYGIGIVVDSVGNAYATGYTSSSSFPTTNGAYDTSYYSGGSPDLDGFILKLNPSGSALLYSTYFGHSKLDTGEKIAVDINGNAYVTGATTSSGFPTTSNVVDTTYNGPNEAWNGDAYVLKLNAAGSALVYSTFIGGSGSGTHEQGMDIVVDSNGNTYVTGYTSSNTFPTTAGAYDESHGGGNDGFIFKLNPTATGFVYSTFVGDTGSDLPRCIKIDEFNNTYVTGWTASTNFPTTTGAYDESHNGGDDIFVLKLNTSGTGLVYSTFVGDTANDASYGLDIDSDGNTYVAGSTYSTNFPTTSDAYDTSYNSGRDGVFLKLNQTGADLTYSTFFGGTGQDYGYRVSVYTKNDVIMIGRTFSNDLPLSSNAFDTSYNGNMDGFISKFKFNPILNVTSLTVLNGGVTTTQIYSRYLPYTIRANILDEMSINDISSVRLSLDPSGANIQLSWDRSSGLFSELSDPNNYVTVDPGSNVINDNYENWEINFNVIFNWNYPDEDVHDIQAYSTSVNLAPAWLNSTGLYSVENDLVFNGSIMVKGEDNRIINENDLVRGGELLSWTGLKVAYEGTTDVYPPDTECDIAAWDELGAFWYDSPASGQNCSIQTETPLVTKTNGFSYTVNISGVPSDNDHTNESFTINIDNDNVTFSNPDPNPANWQTDFDVDLGITIADTGGAEVDGSTVEYTISTDNGTTWDLWTGITGLASGTSIKATQNVVFEEGIENFVKWKAADTIGNGPVESEPYNVMVDTKGLKFSGRFPSNIAVSKTEYVDVGITISDEMSGVDASTISYSTSADSGTSWSNWNGVTGYDDALSVDVVMNITFQNGTENMIKWRASDVAGNGPYETNPYQINVNTWVEPKKILVELLAPSNGATLNTTSVKLEWHVEDKTIENVKFNVILDSTNPPAEIKRYDVSDYSYVIDGLSDEMTYYWTIEPDSPDLDGYCLSGVWWFKIELPPDVVTEDPVYNVDINGPTFVSIFQGESKSIDLTITNLGTKDDIIKVEMDTGKLSASSVTFDYTVANLIGGNSVKRSLVIAIPETTQPDNYELNITVTSTNGGSIIKDSLLITVEVKEKDTTTGKSDPKSDAISNNLLWILIILVIVIAITVMIVVIKRKKAVTAEIEYIPPETVPPADVLPGTAGAQAEVLAAPAKPAVPIPAQAELRELPPASDTERSDVDSGQPVPTPVAGTAGETPVPVIQQPAQPRPEEVSAADVLGIKMDAAAYEPPPPVVQPQALTEDELTRQVDLSGADTSGFVLAGGPKAVEKEAVEHKIEDRVVEDTDVESATKDLEGVKEVKKATEETAVVHKGDSGVWQPGVRGKTKESKEVLEQIEKLGELRSKGLITEEEFLRKKQELLK